MTDLGGADAAGCAAGTQDEDGDGVCHPDCASTSCGSGTCSIDPASGLAACACHPGFTGASCAELAVPGAADVVLWVDAADASSISKHPSAATVAAWSDKGKQAITGTTTGPTTAPSVIDAAQNGRAVLRFDGVDDHVSFPGLTGLTGAEYTVFAVLRNDPATIGTVYRGESALSDSIEGRSTAAFIEHTHSPTFQSSTIACSNESYGGAGWTADQFHLVTFRVSNADLAGWVDGKHMEAIPSGGLVKLSETLDFTVGSGPDGSNAFTGDVAELIIVGKALHYGERLPYEDYLAAKWFGAAFARTPSSFGVPMIWLDASDAASITTANGGVTDWRNHAIKPGGFGNGSFAMSRPTLVPAALNGKAVVRFDGGDALIQNSISVPPGGEEAQYSMLAVIVPPTAQSNSAQTVVKGVKASNDGLALHLMVAPNMAPQGIVALHHRWPAGTGTQDSINVSTDFSKPLLIKVERKASASYDLLANATTSMSTGDMSTNIPDGEILNWTLGGAAIADPGANALQGDVAEVIVLAGELGNAEETALVDMLRAKWGL